MKQVGDYSYSTGIPIGKGSYSQVFRGESSSTNSCVAIKVIENKMMSQSPYIKDLIKKEIDIMGSLTNENVVHLQDVLPTMNNTYLILEYCDKEDVLQKLTKEKRIRESVAIGIIRDVLLGFLELLKKKVMHRDIKPANIFGHKDTFKIGDFGFATFVSTLAQPIRTTTVGTPYYTSPQNLKKECYTSKHDIWSIGILLYEMMFGNVPWPANNPMELVQMLNRQPLQFLPGVPISPECKDFLTKCLQIEEKNRIDWDQLYFHPVFKGFFISKKISFKKNASGYVESVDYYEFSKIADKSSPIKENVKKIENSDNKDNSPQKMKEEINPKTHETNDQLGTIYELPSTLENHSLSNLNIERRKKINIERNAKITEFYLACIELMCGLLIELVALKREDKIVSTNHLIEVLSNTFKIFVDHIDRMASLFKHVNVFSLPDWDAYLGSEIFTKHFELFIQYLQFDGKNIDSGVFDQNELIFSLKCLILEVNHYISKKGNVEMIPFLNKLIIFYEKLDYILLVKVFVPEFHSSIPLYEKPDYNQLRFKIYNFNL